MSLVLNDVAKFVSSKIEVSEINESNYISTENMLPNKGGITIASSLPDTKSVREYMPKDILINNIRPYFKKIWYSDMEGGCSNDIYVLRSNENYDSKFLYYVLSSDDFFNYVMANAKGTKMPRGDKKAIQNYTVPNFSIDKQQKISSFLGEIDRKIEINKKLNKNLEEQILKIFDNWFFQFDLSDEFIESTLGLIPKGWVVDYLGSKRSCFIIGSGINEFNNSKIYIATADVDNSIITNDETLITIENKPSRANMQPIEKSIWFAKMIDSRKLIMVDDYCHDLLNNYIFSTGFCGLKCSDNYFYYLWTFLLSDTFDTLKNNFCTGTTMQAINNKDTKLIEFVLPDDIILSKFNAIAEPLFKEIYYNNLEIKKLQKLRDILLPKLMSGEIDVSEVNCDLKIISPILYKKSENLILRSDKMKTKIISKIQNQMKPYLNQGQYLKLTNSLLNSFKDIELIDNNNEMNETDNFKLLKLFLSAKQVEGCSDKTIVYYKSTIEKMLLKLKKQVYNITTDDLRKYLFDHKYAKNSSKTTIDNIRRIFSSFFSWLEDEDYILKNPVRRIHRVKTGRVVKEVLTDENLEVLRDNCDEIRDLSMVELLISTGIRVGELVNLNINDVDFYERECVVFGKGESERVVYFDARTKIHLMEYLQTRTDTNPALFVSLNKPFKRLGINGVETRLRELGKKCNINNVHPHKFRRTMATNAIDKGMPIEQVQKLLGHVQIDTTMQYAMVNQSNVKLAHRKFIG
ncbi:site-specific tyrosine recombinase/integron integrase [Methanobrevibacter sp. V74]|uniref:site-specific tyrosine recombinase/integron integrase n=1 Tax=Methanobrevibacter sp. V74 TaxID=3064279 RepID=UPI002732BBD1|nr:site-specific tyrosine recombinase/integron integrase [Methanobrevibacter sp. V74]